MKDQAVNASVIVNVMEQEHVVPKELAQALPGHNAIHHVMFSMNQQMEIHVALIVSVMEEEHVVEDPA